MLRIELELAFIYVDVAYRNMSVYIERWPLLTTETEWFCEQRNTRLRDDVEFAAHGTRKRGEILYPQKRLPQTRQRTTSKKSPSAIVSEIDTVSEEQIQEADTVSHASSSVPSNSFKLSASMVR